MYIKNTFIASEKLASRWYEAKFTYYLFTHVRILFKTSNMAEVYKASYHLDLYSYSVYVNVPILH